MIFLQSVAQAELLFNFDFIQNDIHQLWCNKLYNKGKNI